MNTCLCIETGTFRTTSKISFSRIRVIKFTQIIRRIIVYIRIAIRIDLRTIVIDSSFIIKWVNTIIDTRLVIIGHIFSRTDILRIRFRSVDTSMSTHIDLTVTYFPALSCNQNYSVSSPTTIQYHSTSSLQKCYLINLASSDVVNRTGNTIYQDQCIAHSPKVTTSNESFRSLQRICTVRFVQIFTRPQYGNTSSQVFIRHCRIGYVYQ